jgi:AbrB family looped-hinge helix DNA binding protein
MKTYTRLPMSKITERGQITLPKQMRLSVRMRGASAVEFVDTPHGVFIRPVRAAAVPDEQTQLFIASMGDWSDPANDDLFDFTKTV